MKPSPWTHPISETPSESEFPSPAASRPSSLSNHPAIRNYLLFCLWSLFVLVVCLADRGLEWWCLVPPLIGCVSLLAYWSMGPPLVLFSLTGLIGLTVSRPGGTFGGRTNWLTPTFMDFVLCMAMLAYVVGHYRLLSLVRPLFPMDSRHQDEAAKANRRRSVNLVTAGEIAFLVAVLPVWIVLAVLLWTWMNTSTMDFLVPLNISREMWRILRLVWATLAVLAASGILTAYVRRTTATPEESLLYLQDQCWRHTRREQGVLNRWLTWARLRALEKKESS